MKPLPLGAVGAEAKDLSDRAFGPLGTSPKVEAWLCAADLGAKFAVLLGCTPW